MRLIDVQPCTTRTQDYILVRIPGGALGCTGALLTHDEARLFARQILEAVESGDDVVRGIEAREGKE